MNRIQTMRFACRLWIAVIAIISGVLPAASFAQSNERPNRGVNPIDSYLVSDIERINLSNGNVTLTLPLASLPPIAGGKLNFGIWAIYNSKMWDTFNTQVIDNSQNPPAVVTVSTLQASPLAAWRIGSRFTLISTESRDEIDWQVQDTDPDRDFMNANPSWFKVMLEDPDGAQHELRPLDFQPYDTVNGMERSYLRGYYRHTPNSVGSPMRYYSVDGSYLWAVIYPTGGPIAWEVYQRDGTRIVQLNNQTADQKITDTNGNSIKITHEFTPQTGATEIRVADEATGRYISYTELNFGEIAEVKYQTVGGVWVTINLTFDETTVTGKKYTVDDPICPEKEEFLLDIPFRVLRDITLPATGGSPRKFLFEYNSDQSHSVTHMWRPICPGPLQPRNMIASNGWGSLSKMTTPTNALVEYDYSLDSFDAVLTAADATKEAVSQKTITHDSTFDVWAYDINTHSVQNPDGSSLSQQEHSAFEGKAGLAYRTVQSGKVMTERQWGLLKFDGSNTDSPKGTITFNPVVTAEFTTLLEGGLPVKMSAKTFQYDFNGNLVSQAEYDWFDPELVEDNRDGNGVPTAIPSVIQPIRVLTNTFHNPAGSPSSQNVYARRSISTATPRILTAPSESTVGPARTQFHYDGVDNTAPTKGNLTKERHFKEGTSWIETTHTYDAAGNRLTTTDPKGNIITFVYDPATQAQPTEVTVDPDSIVTGDELTTTTTYDFATGLVLSVTDSNGNVATTSYTNHLLSAVDPFGRPGTVTDPQGRKTETRYHDNLRQVEVWSDLASPSDLKLRARTSHDQLGRVVKTESSENGSTYTIFSDTQYQQAGRIVITTNPLRATAASTDGWTRTTKDDLGRVILVETFSGRPPSGTSTGVVTTSYDANVTTVTDQAGKTRRSIVDGLGRLVRVDEPNSVGNLGAVDAPNQDTRYTYDSRGNLIQVQQGTQPARTFVYDALSRLKQASNPESDTISYSYDDNGNLLTKTDARGVVTTFTYDGINRLRTRSYSGPAPGGATPPVTYNYDASGVPNSKGRLTSVTSTVSSYTYSGYDAMGRVLGGTQITAGQNYSMTYTYDLAGNMTEETYPSGRVVQMEFDSAGRMAGIKKDSTTYYAGGAPGSPNAIAYTAHGAVSTSRLGNGRWEHTNFNSRLQPFQIGLGTSPTDSSVMRLDYTYGTTNNNGNVLTQQIVIAGSLDVKQTYTYDELNRLKTATEVRTSDSVQTWNQQYDYDRWGNRAVNASSTLVPNPALTLLSLSDFNTSNNRIQKAGFGYDAAGNLTGDPTTGANQMQYDGENRLISYTKSGATTTYEYDGDGHRVKKVSGGVTTVFVYNVGGQLIAEYTDPSQPVQGGGGTSYLTTDHLGSTRVVTKQDGSVKARYDYLPFGEELPDGIGGRTLAMGYGGADATKQKFTQKERDSESGLDYFLARYYFGPLGRFTTPDEPLSGQNENDPQTWNLYTYTSNNPLARHDPDGRRWFYREDNGVVVDVQWVNPNSDGTYASPGEGWIEFVPTKDKPALVVPLYDEEGSYLGNYHFHEKADGSPFTHIAWSGATKTVGPQLVLDFLILKGVGKIGGAAIGAFGRLGARALEAWRAHQAAKAVEALAGSIRFTKTTLERMNTPARAVPRELLADAIQKGTRLADPQAAPGAIKIVHKIVLRNKPRTLTVIYREADKTILHFHYH